MHSASHQAVNFGSQSLRKPVTCTMPLSGATEATEATNTIQQSIRAFRHISIRIFKLLSSESSTRSARLLASSGPRAQFNCLPTAPVDLFLFSKPYYIRFAVNATGGEHPLKSILYLRRQHSVSHFFKPCIEQAFVSFFNSTHKQSAMRPAEIATGQACYVSCPPAFSNQFALGPVWFRKAQASVSVWPDAANILRTNGAE